MDCKAFSERRFKCHSVYGKGGEDCLNEELTEKRCLSLYHCPNQAREYYGSAAMDLKSDDGQAPAFMSNKALCASWAESFAYVDKALEYGENVAEHHRDAQIVVSKDKVLKRECRDIAFSLARCLRNKKLFWTVSIFHGWASIWWSGPFYSVADIGFDFEIQAETTTCSKLDFQIFTDRTSRHNLPAFQHNGHKYEAEGYQLHSRRIMLHITSVIQESYFWKLVTPLFGFAHLHWAVPRHTVSCLARLIARLVRTFCAKLYTVTIQFIASIKIPRKRPNSPPLNFALKFQMKHVEAHRFEDR